MLSIVALVWVCRCQSLQVSYINMLCCWTFVLMLCPYVGPPPAYSAPATGEKKAPTITGQSTVAKLPKAQVYIFLPIHELSF